MKEETANRSKLLQVRLTPKEYDTIIDRCSKSTCRKLSDYTRKKLLDKPITFYHRNQSLDEFMAEMILLRKELSAIGINYNQTVKRLNSLKHFGDIKTWAILNESSGRNLIKKMEEIKLKISQINDQWLQ